MQILIRVHTRTAVVEDLVVPLVGTKVSTDTEKKDALHNVVCVYILLLVCENL